MCKKSKGIRVYAIQRWFRFGFSTMHNHLNWQSKGVFEFSLYSLALLILRKGIPEKKLHKKYIGWRKCNYADSIWLAFLTLMIAVTMCEWVSVLIVDVWCIWVSMRGLVWVGEFDLFVGALLYIMQIFI